MVMNVSSIAQQRGITTAQVELLRSQSGLTQEGIEQLPESKLKRALRRLDYPDAPRARLMFRLEQSLDDQKNIPNQPVVAALRELDGMRLRTPRRAVAGVPTGGAVAPASLAIVPPPAAGLAPRQWKSLGPGNIGGRTRSIVVHPINPNVMWAGSAGGGIWRTGNAGANWVPVDDFMANLAVTSMVMDPKGLEILMRYGAVAFLEPRTVRLGRRSRQRSVPAGTASIVSRLVPTASHFWRRPTRGYSAASMLLVPFGRKCSTQTLPT
jgi:hypothetical protein